MYALILLLLAFPAWASHDSNCDGVVAISDFLHLRADLNKPPVDRCLRWDVPTQNVDGSTLTDLAGFRVYCNDELIVQIDDPTATSWHFPESMKGYFQCRVESFDTNGNASSTAWFGVDRRRLEE